MKSKGYLKKLVQYYRKRYEEEFARMLLIHGDRNYKDRQSRASWHKELKRLAAKNITTKTERCPVFEPFMRKLQAEIKY